MSRAAAYAISFVAGVFITALFLFYFARWDFFGVGAGTYASFAVFCIVYALAGFTLRYFLPGDAAVHGLLVALPMLAFFFLLNFGDISPLEQLPRWLSSLSPLMSFAGAFSAQYFKLRRAR